jgi:predicted AAA+ superfamily ATPase
MTTRGDLKKAVLDWMGWFKKFSQELVPRENVPTFKHDLCLALTGVRRSGKTSTAVQIAKELKKTDATFYFNFEDPVFFSGGDVESIDILITLYEEHVGIKPTLVILDEVQNIKGWERWVRKAIDIGQYQVIVTGSSSQLLSSEIATAISGRVIEHTIWPLSFSEYLSFIKVKPTSEGIWIRELDNYLRWGGFPKLALIKDESERIMLLKQYLSDIVLRDVVSRHSIKNQHALNQIVTSYLMGMSCLHSYNSLRKAFGFSIELASSLTHYLSQAFLIFEMGRYHPNLKVQARDPKKIYVIDPGLRTVSLVSEREDWGHLAENIVYIELRRRGKEVYYFKGQKEVDFVITELGRPIEAIQVAYSSLDQKETKEREVSALIECLTSLGLKKGQILTSVYEDVERMNDFTIEYIPLHQWLRKIK